LLIAIPSKGRAGKTTSDKILPNFGTFFVPSSELHQYEGLVKNVVGVPKEVRGITPTRNWILENAEDDWVVFVDDDVKAAGYIQLLERNGKHRRIGDELFWVDEFVRYFDVCEQLGYKIWGLKTESARRAVYPYKPILLQSYVTASCMGIVNDGEYMFDEDFVVKEDYELCLRHIRDKGGILAVRYLYWENDHWGKAGGCRDYRTIGVERDAIKRLIKMYPGMVGKAKRKANEFTIRLNF
jgi:glycosyltransferase involved in cell wall biosynthesis